MDAHDTARAATTVVHRRGQPKAPFLLVVNKGPGALSLPREGGAWDLLEIYFMPADIEAVTRDPERSAADHVVFEYDRNKRKFAIIKRLFEDESILQRYRCVMMFDDDLLPVGCSIRQMFELFESTGLRIGQPALTRDSYWAHEVVLRHPRFRWRRTNFAEVMCPVMTLDALRDYVPYFDETVSSFGLDLLWSQREWDRRGGLAVLDATPVRHTRPVRGGVAYRGLSPAEERYAFLRRHRLREVRNLTLGGLPIDDGPLSIRLPIRHHRPWGPRLRFALTRAGRRIGFAGGLAWAMLSLALRRGGPEATE